MLISTVESVKMISILLMMIFDSSYCTICSLSYNNYMILICSMHLTVVKYKLPSSKTNIFNNIFYYTEIYMYIGIPTLQ